MNKELVAKYKVSIDDIDYAEYCSFNMNVYKELFSYIVLIRDEYNAEYSIDNYNHFLNEFKEARQKYYICLRHIISIYAPEYLDDDSYEVELNFAETTMSIYKRQSCSCMFNKEGDQNA